MASRERTRAGILKTEAKKTKRPSAIPPARVYFPPEDIADLSTRIGDILASGRLTLGPYTEELEHAFAAHHRRKHGIAVNSGTSALEVILRALRITDGEVIVPTNTFAATAFAVVHAGNRVVLADADQDLFLDIDSVEQAITRDTKAVVAVYIGGRVVPAVEELADLCREKGVPLIEDAAHAQGSRLGSRFAGSFGVASAFSFYPTKVMTSGEGGMIVTDNDSIDATSRVLRDQGKAGFTQNLHTELGYNWRLSEIHACIGLSQLKRLSEFIEARRRVAGVFDRGLEDLEQLHCFQEKPGMYSNYYKYIAVLPKSVARAEFKAKLKTDFGVSLSGEVYEAPLHEQPVFKYLGAGRRFPTAEDLCSRHVCLPIFATMSDDQARWVVDAVHDVMS